MKKGYVFDVETIANLFVAVFRKEDSEDRKVFVIHPLRNDYVELMDFLENIAEEQIPLIGFNSLGFDGPLTEGMLRNRASMEVQTPDEITSRIYAKAQKLIEEQNYDNHIPIPERLLSIKHVDVFKINHWDNPGKKASLKWLQFTLDWSTVMEMPIHHSTTIETIEEIEEVIEYCSNDVDFTKFLYQRTLPDIEIRKRIQQKYKINCINYSNTKLGSELLLSLYAKKTGKKKWDIRGNQTHRKHINIKELILPYIRFSSPEFNKVLELYNEAVLTNTKEELKFSIGFEGYKFDYGKGGIHQCIKSGCYYSDEEYIIKDADVASLYPSIACVNQMYPKHLGPEFFQVYKSDIVDVRLAEKDKGEKGDKGIVKGFKEAANATFGNSNNKHSWLMDFAYTMQTTCNGQLLISMLVESLVLSIPKCKLLQTNTDGLTLMIPRSQEELYLKLCREWEAITGLKLEFVDYKAMFIRDVNNYLSIPYEGKPKMKGAYDFTELDAHKNKSFLIVPKAVYEHLANGVDITEYITSSRNIYDFCGGNRAMGAWDFIMSFVSEGERVEIPAQRVVRYYISNSGVKIIKVHREDGRRIQTIAGPWMQTEFNKFIEKPWEQYDINYKYYIEETLKEVDNIKGKKNIQLELNLFGNE